LQNWTFILSYETYQKFKQNNDETRWDEIHFSAHDCSRSVALNQLRIYWLVVVVRQFRNFSTILWWVQVNFQWEDGEVQLHWVGFFLIVLAHWNNSPRVDISFQSDTLFWFRASAVMLRLSVNWKSIKKRVYFLVQYTRKCINSTHLSHKPIQ
jgi:hypothetical protein